MKRFVVPLAAAFALTLAASSPSRADDIFYYNWSRTPSSINLYQTNNPGQQSQSGVINLLDLNSGAVAAQGSTANPAVDLQVISSTDATNPDTLPSNKGNYTLTLTLSLQDPSKNPGTPTATVSFNGQLQATDSIGSGITALSTHLSNSILSSTDATGTHAGQQFATVTLGNETFTVSYDPTRGFAEPGPSAEATFGAISFGITEKATINGGKAPEPSGVVLGCLGLTFLGGVVYRARRRKVEALKAMA